MKKYVVMAAVSLPISLNVFAGQISGGGLGKQLQEVAMSETMMSAADVQDVVGDNFMSSSDESFAGTSVLAARAVDRSREIPKPAGVMIEVQSSDFTLVTTDAANGQDFVYRDVPVRAATVDTQAKVVTMHPVEDLSITIVVKDAGSK